MRTMLLAGSLLLGVASTTMAHMPVDLSAIDQDMAGARTQVLVLPTLSVA